MIPEIIKAVMRLAADAITGAIWFIRAAVSFVFTFLGSQWRQYTPFGQLLFLVALGLLVADAGISYQYGKAQTMLHAYGFMMLAVAFCLLPDVAVSAGRNGNTGGAVAMGLASLLIGGVVAQSHLGYGGGVRMGAMQEHGFQTMKAADVRDGVKSETANLATLRLALKSATMERDQLRMANPWAATTTAPALEADIANAEGDFIFKRSKACKDVTVPESRVFCDKLKDLRAQLGTIKELGAAADNIGKVQARIEAAQAKIDGRTATAAATKVESNVVVNQNAIAAVLVNWWNGERGASAITPTATQQQVANIAIAAFNALGFLVAAPALMVAAGFFRVPGALGGLHGGPGGHGGLPHPVSFSAPAATPVALAVHPDASAASAAMQAATARRLAVRDRLTTMRQSRVDGGLLSRAA